MARIYLVGAGPGDPELITLKALRILSSAPVILYDALASTDLLNHCPAGSIKIFVGKRYGCHALSQQEINLLMIEKARLHGTVVRLKGGDPFVFFFLCFQCPARCAKNRRRKCFFWSTAILSTSSFPRCATHNPMSCTLSLYASCS